MAESSTMAVVNSCHTRKRRRSRAIAIEVEGPTIEVKQQRKGRVGKLAGLMGMPLDVLFEILGHLKPYDLLRLARMTKEFRRVLMHKSSISVWKSAREKLSGLPQCPPGMTEPQWANLAFDPHCHFCLTPGIRTVEWRLRVRICAKCAKEHLGEYNPLSQFDSTMDDSPALETLIPFRFAKRHRRAFLWRDYAAVEKEYSSIHDADAQRVFVQERHRLLQEIETHAKLCVRWAHGQTLGRSVELEQLRDDRRCAVIEKLEALGWQKDIIGIRYPDSLADHRLVKQPHRLTERIWSNIQGPILEFMAEMRVKRLARERIELILERKRSAIQVLCTYKNARLPATEIMPEPADFCDFLPIKAILELPVHMDVDESSFTDILPILPSLIEAWRAKIHQELVRTMNSEDADIRGYATMTRIMMLWNEDTDEDEDFAELEDSNFFDEESSAKLKLATSVFQCSTCIEDAGSFASLSDSSSSSDSSHFSTITTKPLFYPKVFGHICLTRASGRLWSWDVRPDPSKRLDFYTQNRRKWTSRPLRLDRRLGKQVEAVVEAAGMDPMTTTADEMNHLDLWFVCSRCAIPTSFDGPHVATAFGWRDAVAHHAEAHGRGLPKWRTITPAELEATRWEDTSSELPAFYPDEKAWLCAHCRDLPSEREPTTLNNIKTHGMVRHEIPEPELNKDYYRDFAAEPAFATPCKIVLV